MDRSASLGRLQRRRLHNGKIHRTAVFRGFGGGRGRPDRCRCIERPLPQARRSGRKSSFAGRPARRHWFKISRDRVDGDQRLHHEQPRDGDAIRSRNPRISVVAKRPHGRRRRTERSLHRRRQGYGRDDTHRFRDRYGSKRHATVHHRVRKIRNHPAIIQCRRTLRSPIVILNLSRDRHNAGRYLTPPPGLLTTTNVCLAVSHLSTTTALVEMPRWLPSRKS